MAGKNEFELSEVKEGAELNPVQIRAVYRANEIFSARNKLLNKIAAAEDEDNVFQALPWKIEAWKKKIAEYDKSLICISLTIQTGEPVKRKDPKQMKLIQVMIDSGVKFDASNIPKITPGVTVTPGTAQINPKGLEPGI